MIATGRIEILVDRSAPRVWHERLRARLALLLPQATIRLRLADGAGAFPAMIGHLLTLEAMLQRDRKPRFCDATHIAEADANGEFQPGIIIDCTGREQQLQGAGHALVLRPLYNGSPGELAAAAALLEGSSPNLALQNIETGGIVATGLASLEIADGLTGGLEAVASRMIYLIERTLLAPQPWPESSPSPPSAYAPGGVTEYFLRRIAQICARRITRLCCHTPHWRIGWRLNDGPGVMETGDLSGPAWRVLPDLGDAFAADPFAIEWRGKSYIFFEQLDHRVDKGTIFAQEFGAAGPVGAPFLVLEEKWHLSYPSLIVLDDTLYMLPEASMSGAVSIYRCVAFPGKWECVEQLLTGVEAADATIFQHAGRFWMTCVIRDGVGGYSDVLAIHHAPNLLGPWQAHAQRPVLVDARLARPAGAVVTRNGELWRPVQDCSTGYGKRLALARIDVLDPERFSQTVKRIIAPGPDWRGDRLHTLNRWGRLEVIDGAVTAPKNLTLRRLTNTWFE